MIKDNDRSYRVLVKEMRDLQKDEENDNSHSFYTLEKETRREPYLIMYLTTLMLATFKKRMSIGH